MNQPQALPIREYRALDYVAQVRYLQTQRAWLELRQDQLEEQRRQMIDQQEQLEALCRQLQRQSERELPSRSCSLLKAPPLAGHDAMPQTQAIEEIPDAPPDVVGPRS